MRKYIQKYRIKEDLTETFPRIPFIFRTSQTYSMFLFIIYLESLPYTFLLSLISGYPIALFFHPHPFIKHYKIERSILKSIEKSNNKIQPLEELKN